MEDRYDIRKYFTWTIAKSVFKNVDCRGELTWMWSFTKRLSNMAQQNFLWSVTKVCLCSCFQNVNHQKWFKKIKKLSSSNQEATICFKTQTKERKLGSISLICCVHWKLQGNSTNSLVVSNTFFTPKRCIALLPKFLWR